MANIPLYLDFDSGELRPTVADDGSTSDVVPGLLPVNYVVITTVDQNPVNDVGYGTWESLGSGTIGSTDVYYFKRLT